MKNINLGIQIVPKSKSKDTYALVDKAIEVIQQSGVKYEVTPFETVMEGPQDTLMEVAKRRKKLSLKLEPRRSWSITGCISKRIRMRR